MLKAVAQRHPGGAAALRAFFTLLGCAALVDSIGAGAIVAPFLVPPLIWTMATAHALPARVVCGFVGGVVSGFAGAVVLNIAGLEERVALSAGFAVGLAVFVSGSVLLRARLR